MYITPHMLQRAKKVQNLLDQLDTQSAPLALVVPGSVVPRGDIVVFAGSFNPPTIAHLALLEQAQSVGIGEGEADRDKPQPLREMQGVQGQGQSLHKMEGGQEQAQSLHVYAAFSKHTVDKEGVERPLLLDRILLLQMLLRRRLPDVGILLFNRGLYVEQAEAIRASFPRVRRILFLMGFDKVEQILDARYYEDRDAALVALFRQAELLVVPRGRAHEGGQGLVGKGLAPFLSLRELLDRSENRRFARFIHALPFDPRYKDISSTRLRQDGVAYAHDVPQEVRQFMKETRAYAPPVRRADGSMVDVYAARVRTLRLLLQGPVS
jgi:nicotinic acid mononucleotide adenylyltransferase